VPVRVVFLEPRLVRMLMRMRRAVRVRVLVLVLDVLVVVRRVRMGMRHVAVAVLVAVRLIVDVAPRRLAACQPVLDALEDPACQSGANRSGVEKVAQLPP
jgi:hypothetical protein